MIIHSLNLGGNRWCLIVVILSRIICYKAFQLRGSKFSFLAGGHSHTWPASEGSTLRSKERLTGELISSGFYMRNWSWPQTTKWITGNRRRRLDLHVCESIPVCACVYFHRSVCTYCGENVWWAICICVCTLRPLSSSGSRCPLTVPVGARTAMGRRSLLDPSILHLCSDGSQEKWDPSIAPHTSAKKGTS